MNNKTYNKSDIEWIGQIPNYWKIVAFQYVLDFTVGFTPPTNNSKFYDSDDYDWATIADLNTKFIFDTKNKLSQKGIDSSGKNPVKKGSLLYSFKLSTGKVAFAGKDLYTNEAILAIEPREDRCLDYLYYMLPAILEYNANYNMYGAKIFNQDVINKTILPYPPLDAQNKIAAYLDKKIAEIDTIIEKKETLLLRLEEKKKAIINEAVTEGLNPNVTMKDSGIEWIGKIPAHWEVKKLKYLLNIDGIKIGPFGSALKLDTLVEKGIKIYGQSNVIKDDFTIGTRYLDEKRFIENFTQYEILKGDVLVTMMGTTGKSKVFKEEYERGILDSHLLRLRLNSLLLDPNLFTIQLQFANYLINQINFNSVGSIMAGLNSTIIKELNIILPPLAEQKNILEFLNKKDNDISKLSESIHLQIDKLKEYRQALISEAVTGKLEI